MNFFSAFVAKTSQLKESDDEKIHEEDEDDYLEIKKKLEKKWKLKRKKKSNVKSKEKMIEQMIELQKI